MKLSAPGKLFLAGEYAVLDGAPALVAGIDLRLHAELTPAARSELVHRPSGARWEAGGPVPAELRFAKAGLDVGARLCAEEGRAPGALRLVFENDFAQQGHKLGLGGSAAATVIGVRAACAAHGREVTDAEVVALAAAAHWAEQGGSGSGGDVAACALGGVLRVRALHAWRSAEEVLQTPARALAQATPVEAIRLRVPSDLRLLLVSTGAPADSRALVRAVKAFAAAQPARWKEHAARISAACAALEQALAEAAVATATPPVPGTASAAAPGDARAPASGPGEPRDAALDAVGRGAAAMAALGADAGVAIVTEALQRACDLAAAAGAAAKPSGAGGGDCAVAVCFGDAALAQLESAFFGLFPVLRADPSSATRSR